MHYSFSNIWENAMVVLFDIVIYPVMSANERETVYKVNTVENTLLFLSHFFHLPITFIILTPLLLSSFLISKIKLSHFCVPTQRLQNFHFY